MPYWRHCYHLIWATKGRQALLVPPIAGMIKDHIQLKCEELGCALYAVECVPDHIHVAVSISPAKSVAQVVKVLKGASSHLVNQNMNQSESFRWQNGYGSLTLGRKRLPWLVRYIEDQAKHHAEGTADPYLERIDEDTR